MKTIWLKGLEGEAKQEMAQAFSSSALLRRRLHSLCNSKAEAAFKLSREDYDCPNWHLLQSDTIGYQRALKEIQSLIEENNK